MSKKLEIGKTCVGNECPVFVIAELSANHLQSFEVAAKTLEAISKTGADAVKLQTYTPDTITIDCDNDYFQINTGNDMGWENAVPALPGGIYTMGMAAKA